MTMLAPPIGFVPLKVACDLVRAKLPTSSDAEREVAEACQAGTIIAGYRAWDGGADELDPRIWQRPHWRTLFDLGTVTLDLPLLDDRGNPSADGRMAPRCVREVFVTKESLSAFVAAMPARATEDMPRAKRGPKAGTLERVISEMKRDLLSGQMTVEALSTSIEKSLATRYGVSRETVRKARTQAITGTESKPS